MTELYFRLGVPEGFTAKKLADKKEDYANPIRELLQNSLDASNEAENQQCIVNIYIEHIAQSDIPHIKEYRAVLNQIIEYQQQEGSYNDNAKQVVASIKEALAQQWFKVLMFVDNGIGMSPNTLEALIGERSVKRDGSSAGSFGVGHLTSYFLSSLRYVLYASKYKDKDKVKTLFTGVPILAGHKDNKGIERGSVGRILPKAPKGQEELTPEWQFCDTFPHYINEKMGNISTGSMVAILGLNTQWNEDAEYAIASSFFHAIYNDKLVINHSDTQIDSQYVETLLYEYKDRRQSAVGDQILSDQHTYQSWLTIKDGQYEQIKLSNNDKVSVYIRNDIEASSSIALIRSGMLIARHDKMLSNDINNLRKNEDFAPFSALISVDNAECPQLFKLIKGAEGPYHNQLIDRRLSKEDEKTLKALLKELSDNIKQHLQQRDRGGSYVDMPELEIEIPNKADVKSGNVSGANQPSNPTPKPKPAPPKPKPNNPDNPVIPPRPTPKIIPRQLTAKKSMKLKDNGDTLDVVLNITTGQDKTLEKDEVYFRLSLAQDQDSNQSDSALSLHELSLDGKAIPIEVDTQVKLGKLDPSKTYKIIATAKKPDKIKNIKVAVTPYLGLKQQRGNNNDR